MKSHIHTQPTRNIYTPHIYTYVCDVHVIYLCMPRTFYKCCKREVQIFTPCWPGALHYFIFFPAIHQLFLLECVYMTEPILFAMYNVYRAYFFSHNAKRFCGRSQNSQDLPNYYVHFFFRYTFPSFSFSLFSITEIKLKLTNLYH